MPTPTVDYQASVLGLLMGAGTDYIFGVSGISGLGNPPTKTRDTVLDGRNGQYAAPDYLDKRVILVHIEIVQDTAELALDLLNVLKDAWLPTTADINFHVQLPGMGHVYFIGRPRGLDADLTDLPLGHITCIGEFHGMFPTAQTP